MTNIVVLGPFSLDSNRPDPGLKYFKELVGKSSLKLHLHYVGRVEPAANVELFYSAIQANATQFGLQVSQTYSRKGAGVCVRERERERERK